MGDFDNGRRNFLKTAVWTGIAFYVNPVKLLSNKNEPLPIRTDFQYRYKSVSVNHVKEVGEWFKKLDSEGKLSTNETYRKYIGNFVFDHTKVAPDAKSLVIVSIPLNLISVTFRRNGKVYEIITPTGYFSPGFENAEIKERIMKDVIKNNKYKLYAGPKLPLKTFAVRSGLAEYGKNNITFVGRDYGSSHMLAGFYTNMEMPDNWGPLKVLRECKGCSLCIKNCPTGSITEENFVVNISRCITLYNELPDPMPNWIDPKAHNALAGCNRCQNICPANNEANKRIERVADLTNEETEFLLKPGKNDKIQQSVLKKLSRFVTSADDISYLSRNLNLVLPNIKPQNT